MGGFSVTSEGGMGNTGGDDWCNLRSGSGSTDCKHVRWSDCYACCDDYWFLGYASSIWKLAVQLVPFRPRFDLAAWCKFAWAGVPVGVSLILQIFILHGDTVVLSLIRSSDEVSIYSVAIEVFEIFLYQLLCYLLGTLCRFHPLCAKL